MKPTWLCLDTNYLVWRTFFATGRLVNGVTFGLLRDVQYLTKAFATQHVAFCFDHGKNIRETMYAGYKSSRRNKVVSEEDEEAILLMRREVEKIKTVLLKESGFRNVFYQSGYEADDVCAMVVRQLRQSECDCTIVSADKDLYQCLDRGISLWDPHRKVSTTRGSFVQLWGLEPVRWREVKAVAGCSSDDIKGVRGVGESTAAKFLRGELAENSTKYAAIAEFLDTPEYQTNLSLVTLPLPGLKEVVLDDRTLTPREWNKMAERFGMKSLTKKPKAVGGFGIQPRD